MRKKLAFVLCTLLCCAAFAGCDSKESLAEAYEKGYNAGSEDAISYYENDVLLEYENYVLECRTNCQYCVEGVGINEPWHSSFDGACDNPYYD